MTGNEIRKRFLEHFASREHLVLPSAPLVPQGDPSTLFISAGMQPLQPYYQGFSQPPAPRLASCQKCLRTGDIDEVGKTDRHNTFFEMLGNFAPTGDYFKETAIPLAWELVTDGFAMPADRLRVTIHPTDDEAHEIWIKTGVPAAHITRLEDNWWGLGRGPCGPDSEIWWDRGREVGCGREDCVPDHCDRFTEFWNLVFPQYDQQAGRAAWFRWQHPAIDTGMGLERISYILQGKTNVFETDLLAPIIDRIRAAVGQASDAVRARRGRPHSCCVFRDAREDHAEQRGPRLRAAPADPPRHGSRAQAEHALAARRPGRRGRQGDGASLPGAARAGRRRSAMASIPKKSDSSGRSSRAWSMFERIAAKHPQVDPRQRSVQAARHLRRSHRPDPRAGRRSAASRSTRMGFAPRWRQQRERSRGKGTAAPGRGQGPAEVGVHRLPASSSPRARSPPCAKTAQPPSVATEGDEVEVFLERTPFYAESGGQVGDTGTITTESGRVRVEDTQKPADGVIAHLGTVVTGEVRVGENATAAVDAARRRQIARHHSATHLLHKALRETIGEQVVQKGSWVGPDHTTFDIPLNRAITKDELARINRRVMEKVREALPVPRTARSRTRKPSRRARCTCSRRSTATSSASCASATGRASSAVART